MGSDLRNQFKMEGINNERREKQGKKNTQIKLPIPEESNPIREHIKWDPKKTLCQNMIIRLKTGIPDEYSGHMEPIAKKLIKTQGYDFSVVLPGEDPEITGRKNKAKTGKKPLTAKVLREAVLSQADHAKITEHAQEILKKALKMDYLDEKRLPILNTHYGFWSEFTRHKLKEDHNRDVALQTIQRQASRYLAEKGRLPTVKDVIRMDDKTRQDRQEHKKIANWPKSI